MVLHKVVNGVKMELTPEEEKQFLEEWQANKEKREAQKRLQEEKNAKFDLAMEKLLAPLSDEERAILRERLAR